MLKAFYSFESLKEIMREENVVDYDQEDTVVQGTITLNRRTNVAQNLMRNA